MEISVIDPKRIPRHVACVMDGNGRWANQRGMKRTEGHAAGEEALLEAVKGAIDVGAEWLTVYAFSTENWRRPTDEVRFLMKFNEKILVGRRDELNEMGVRVRFIGRRDWRVPRRLIRRMDETTELTKNNTLLTLTIAFNYGGRAELVDAVKGALADGQEISEKTITEHLYDPEMPEVDLWIRTSGESRMSNYLIWQSAYAELLFIDTYWPDFRRQHMVDAVVEFQDRERRFGGLT
ncbi:MAG: polyprenyl diphosphate synthase [Acidimicrobiales bacterium]